MRVLLIEDDSATAASIEMMLKSEGFICDTTDLGEDGLEIGKLYDYDIIVLDLMLPDIDGIEVCKRVRQRSDVPILMLTARDDDVDKIVGLEVGADDYMTKPFNPRELVARIRSILRRATAPPPKSKGRKEHGAIVIDAGRREVTVNGQQVQLAPKEFDLLWELLDHRGMVLTREQLLERVWGYTFVGDTRTVDVHVRQLRRKIGEDCPVVTVWGVGYKVADDAAPVA